MPHPQSTSASISRLRRIRLDSYTVAIIVLSALSILLLPLRATSQTIYGPPLPPQRVRIQQLAHRLREELQAGRLRLLVEERDGDQLRTLEAVGIFCWPAPPPGIVIRSPRQRDILEGTNEESVISRFPLPLNMSLASRSAQTLRPPSSNPTSDPDFDPCHNPPSPRLLHMLTTLAAHSSRERPLEILSLLRPPYRFGDFIHVGPANPHSLGLAVDIAAYAGHPFRIAEPQECVAATLALLRDLPPGRYRLGVPKAPEPQVNLPPALQGLLAQKPLASTGQQSNPTKTRVKAPVKPGNQSAASVASLCHIAALYGRFASDNARSVWPFFPAPYTEIVPIDASGEEITAYPSDLSHPTYAIPGIMQRSVVRFANESYAPEEQLHDPRLRAALTAARQRGADVIALFPDGADHIHIDVRQTP